MMEVRGSRFQVGHSTDLEPNHTRVVYAAVNTTFRHSSCLLLKIA